MPQLAKSRTNSGSRAASKSKSNNSSRTKSNNSSRSAKSGTSQRTSMASQNGQGELLEKFFLDSLKDLYWAEKHLTKALPKMRKAATNEELISAFEEHLEVTEEHVQRLEQIFEMMGKKPQAKKCEAMEGLTKEAESIIEETEKGTATRDVGLIIAAQKVEHYEIASYGGLAQLAKTMGLEEIKDLLGQTLEEEKETDERLTSIAENDINLQAEQETEEDANDE